MITNNIYSVNDKVMFDALNQSKVTIPLLYEIFISRGIVISEDTSREELASMFSRMPHGYTDYEKLATVFSSVSRREKSTLLNIPADNISEKELVDTLRDIDDDISEINQAEAKVSKDGDIIRLSLTYKEVNFNKSEFRQVLDKEAEVEIEKHKNVDDESYQYLIRHPLNTTCESVVSVIIEKLKKNVMSLGGHLSTSQISLTGIKDPATRSKFFLDMMNEMEGVTIHDVTFIYVYQPKNDEDWIEDESEDEEFDEIEGSKRLEGVHISKASLNGNGVAFSKEFQNLQDSGFYIWKAVWMVKEDGADSDIYELEAQFADPEHFTKFSYLVRGEYRYQDVSSYSKNRVKCSKKHEIKFSRLIEATAERIIKEIEYEVRAEGML